MQKTDNYIIKTLKYLINKFFHYTAFGPLCIKSSTKQTCNDKNGTKDSMRKNSLLGNLVISVSVYALCHLVHANFGITKQNNNYDCLCKIRAVIIYEMACSLIILKDFLLTNFLQIERLTSCDCVRVPARILDLFKHASCRFSRVIMIPEILIVTKIPSCQVWDSNPHYTTNAPLTAKNSCMKGENSYRFKTPIIDTTPAYADKPQ